MGNNVNWIQIIFLVLVFGGGAIQWLVRKLAEQRAVRQAKAEQERLELERLRTGRVQAQAEDTDVATARVDVDAIATQRQRQLEELRRRQQAARRPTPARPTASRPTAPRPTGSGPVAPGQAAPSRRAPGQAPSSATGQRRSAIHDLPASNPTASVPTSHQSKVDSPDSKTLELAQRFEQQEREADRAKRRAATDSVGGLTPRTPAEWRRAIIASEILAKPLSERDQQAG